MKRKKRKVKSPLQKLKSDCEKLWKLCCKKRDGNKCVYCGSTTVLQVDHCFSRTCGELFLEIQNGTTLCRSCHYSKTHGYKRMDRVVDDFVKKREGEHWWEYAESVYLRNQPYDWNFPRLEEKMEELKEYLK